MNNIPIYLIYLPNYFNRWQPTLKNLVDNGINPILFQGVDGNTWKLKTDLSENKFPKKFTSGRIGCFLSHFMLWNHLSHVTDWETVIVFEDDVRIDSDFKKKFDDVYEQLPTNWDFVHLGSLWDVIKPEKQYSPNLLIGKPYCTHAYMFNKRIISILTKECSELNAYLDVQLNEQVLSKINHFVVEPPLVKQESLGELSEYKSLCRDWDTFL